MNKIINFLCVFVLMSTMIACGGSSSTTPPTPMTDAELVAADKTALEVTLGGTDTGTTVTTSITLTAAGVNGSTITWTSDTPGVIADDGTVVRPPFGSGDTTVILTATITKGSVTETKTFTLTVLETPPTDAEAVAADKASLVDGTIKGANTDLDNVTVNLTSPLPSSGSSGTTITWSSSTPGVIANNGTVTRPAFGDGDAIVTFTATITKGFESDTKIFTITVLEAPQTDAEAVAADMTSLVDASIKGANVDLDNVTLNLTSPLPSSGSSGTTIMWSSGTPGVIANNGTVTRPAFGDGDAIVTFTATITKGLATDTKDFTITVLEISNSSKEITAFSFTSPAATGVITEGSHTIAITVPNGTVVTALVATFTTTGASVKIGLTVQTSGTTANDFTIAKTYTVTAVDTSTQDYEVTVTIAPPDTENSVSNNQENLPGSVIETPSFTALEEIWLAPDGKLVGDTTAFVESNTMTANFDPATLVINVPLSPGQYYLYKIRKSDKVVLEKSTYYLTVLGEVPRNLYNGEMYMSFADGSNSDKVTVQKYSDGTWTTVGAAGFTSDSVNWGYPPCYQVSVDQSSGKIYMVYEKATGGWTGQGQMYEYDGISWSSVWTNAFSTFFPNIYITLDGTKYLFYKDNSSGWVLCLTKITALGIATKINFGASYPISFGTSMFVENGILYIAFAGNPAYNTSVIKYDTATAFNTGNVSLVGIANFTPGDAYSPVIYATGGTPYVAYSDNTSAQKLSVMKFDSADWVQVGSAGITTNAITTFQTAYDFTDYNSGDLTKHCYISIAICANGSNVYVTAEDKTTMQASIYKYNGTSWSTLQSNYATKTVEPTITYDNGDLVIVYKKIDKSGMVIYTCPAN